MDFFTSDTHFNHDNIIKYCNRPFANVAEMNERLVLNWNARVSKEDRVFVLGDFALGKKGDADYIFDLLNGEKHLIDGNHDGSHTRKNLKWATTNTMAPYAMDDDNTIMLVHNPATIKKRPSSGIILHGHLHGTMDLHPFPKLPHTKYIDVGVDCWEYQPVTLTELLAGRG